MRLAWSFSIYLACVLIIWIKVETIYVKRVGEFQFFYMQFSIPLIFIALLPFVRDLYKKIKCLLSQLKPGSLLSDKTIASIFLQRKHTLLQSLTSIRKTTMVISQNQINQQRASMEVPIQITQPYW